MKNDYEAVRPERRRDVPAGEWDNWSDVVYPASYLDPKGRGDNSMMRKGR